MLALTTLSLLMVAALAGLAGVEETLAEEADVATVTWHAPARIRNGEFFEMRLQVDAHERIDELVVGVDAALWEDFTINTFFPAAAEEASEAEIQSEMRLAGIAHVRDVAWAILERTGKMSFIKREEASEDDERQPNTDKSTVV